MNENNVRMLSAIIKELHHDPAADPDALRERFRSVAGTVSAQEIATAEQEAIEGGIPIESIRRLCDVHLGVFSDEALAARVALPERHPIAILYAEHDTLLSQIRSARQACTDPEACAAVRPATIEVMRAAERYFVKEENALFPVIERYGITRPPAIMWSEHDALRESFKRFAAIGDDREAAAALLVAAEEVLVAHVHKEETILFKAALAAISDGEWETIRRDFDDIGYMHGAPTSDRVQPATSAAAAGRPASNEATGAQTAASISDGTITLPSGSLSSDELRAILDLLPVDITFVDADDEVAYFSESSERIFPRARSVIGRNVRNCHPPRSVHVVEEILRSFRAGEKESESFHLHLGERYILIRYYAVRSPQGAYLGCLEVSQDIAPIQRISGERRIAEASHPRP